MQVISLKPSLIDDSDPAPSDDLSTRSALEDVVERFGLAFDLRDWDMFGACLDDRVLMDRG